MKKIYCFQILFFIVLFFFSCKKDKLEGDLQQLAGNWEWARSSGPCFTKYPNFCYYSPKTEGYTLSLEFLAKGKYIKYTNEKKQSEEEFKYIKGLILLLLAGNTI